MPVIRTSAPLVEPLTLAQAKAHLRVDGSDEDTLITALIGVAREACEDRTEQTLVETAWRYTTTHLPHCGLRLMMGPVLSVQSVAYIDTNGQTQTLASDQWRLADDWLLPAYGVVWPLTLCQPAAVTVAYKCGFGSTAASVPGPLVAWMKLAIGDLFENRTANADKPAVPQHFADMLLLQRGKWLP